MGRSIAAIVIACVSVSGWSAVHADCRPTPPPEDGPTQKLPDLNGAWEGGDGHVTLHVLPNAQRVDAFFDQGSGTCPFGDARGVLFDGKFDGHVLRGKMTHCTHLRRLIDVCKMEPVFSTEFYTTFLTEHDITGCYKSEYYKAIDKYAGSKSCNLTRDPSGDHWVEFHLTKTSISCPDLGELQHAQQVAARAQGIIAIAAHATGDPKARDILSRAQKLLGTGMNALMVAAATGHECTEIRDSANELRRFLDAIRDVNAATCGQNLARAFDELFAAAGTLGQRLPDLPATSTAFTLLAADRTFFQDVSHALNPEERWNAQFSGIEGYTMTCR